MTPAWVTSATFAADTCDRQCLRGFIGAYPDPVLVPWEIFKVYGGKSTPSKPL
jgi:hypothetical protein